MNGILAILLSALLALGSFCFGAIGVRLFMGVGLKENEKPANWHKILALGCFAAKLTLLVGGSIYLLMYFKVPHIVFMSGILLGTLLTSAFLWLGAVGKA